MQDRSKYNWDGSALKDMFQTVRDLLLKISTFEMAVMCANWVAKELPMGKSFNFNIQRL